MKENAARFESRLVDVFNKSLHEAIDEIGGWFRQEKELTKDQFLKIIIVSWGPEGKADDYTRKLTENKKSFTNENLKDIVNSIKNKGDEEHGGDVNLVREVLDEMGAFDSELIEKVKKGATANLSENLNQMWRDDFDLPDHAELPIWEIISFYFLRSFENEIIAQERPKGKRIDNFVDGDNYCTKLDNILAEKNLAIIQGEHRSGKTVFVEWYVNQKDKNVFRINWTDDMDFIGILRSVPTLENDIMEQLAFEMDIYGGNVTVEAVKKYFRGISFPNHFTIVIDNFNGSQALMDELGRFAEDEGGENSFQIIVITNGIYNDYGQILTVNPLHIEGLYELFEKYSGMKLAEDAELKELVMMAGWEAVGWPELMILLGEAYASNFRVSRNNALTLLRSYLDASDTSVSDATGGTVQELKFNSALNRPQSKLRGHIRKVYEPLKKDIGSGVLFLLSCLRGDSFPEKYLKKLCSLQECDVRDLCSNHCIDRENDNVFVRVPYIIASTMLKNNEDRQDALECVKKFMLIYNYQIRGEESEIIERKWMKFLIQKALEAVHNWHKDPFKDELKDQRFHEVEQEFFMCCIMYYTQNFTYNDSLKDIMDFMIDEEIVSPVIHVCKTFLLLLGKAKDRNTVLDYGEKKVSEDIAKLDKLDESSQVECNAYREFCETWADVIFLCFKCMVEYQDTGLMKIRNDSYSIFTNPLTKKFFDNFEKVWNDCDRKGVRPFKDISFYKMYYRFIVFYSNIKSGVFPLQCCMNNIFPCLENRLKDMIQVYYKMFNGKRGSKGRDRIVEFDWCCEITTLYILYCKMGLELMNGWFYYSNPAYVMEALEIINQYMDVIYFLYWEIGGSQSLSSASIIKYLLAEFGYVMLHVKTNFLNIPFYWPSYHIFLDPNLKWWEESS